MARPETSPVPRLPVGPPLGLVLNTPHHVQPALPPPPPAKKAMLALPRPPILAPILHRRQRGFPKPSAEGVSHGWEGDWVRILLVTVMCDLFSLLL
jgi:hypothetical protein